MCSLIKYKRMVTLNNIFVIICRLYYRLSGSIKASLLNSLNKRKQATKVSGIKFNTGFNRLLRNSYRFSQLVYYISHTIPKLPRRFLSRDLFKNENNFVKKYDKKIDTW